MRGLRISLTAAAVGAAVVLVGLVVAPHEIALSYLSAYMATVAVVLGTLLLVMMAHLSGATWFVVLRRQAEGVVGSLPVLAVLMLPLLIVPGAFWPWAAASPTPPIQAALRAKGPYLHMWFFVARAIAYWIVWVGAGELLRRASRAQDAGDEAASGRMRRLSAGGIPPVGLALTFAAFDWMMSLSPAWSSAVYGIYYFAGAMVSALALLAVVAFARVASGGEWLPSGEHLNALGRLTLAFVLFWGYIWYAQFFVIWIADIPREAVWYLTHLRGAWEAGGLMVLIGGFAVPLILLLFLWVRRSAIAMGTMGIWLLLVHYFDVYWLIMPGSRVQWSAADLVWDIGALLFVGGSASAVAVWRHAGAPAVPTRDPLLDWSLRYEAH